MRRQRRRGCEPPGCHCGQLDPSDLRDHFPSIAIEDLLLPLHEPEACVVRASQCVHALVDRARQRGANMVFGLATPHPDGLLVNGEVLSADRVVWACGAWLGKLFPQWAPVTATRQDVFYWDSPAEWRNGLSWQDVDQQMYGFPDVDGLGVKAVTDKPGRPLDLEHAVPWTRGRRRANGPRVSRLSVPLASRRCCAADPRNALRDDARPRLSGRTASPSRIASGWSEEDRVTASSTLRLSAPTSPTCSTSSNPPTRGSRSLGERPRRQSRSTT